MKQIFKNIKKGIQRVMTVLSTAIFWSCVTVNYANASGLQETKIVTGTKKLLKDASTALLAIGAVATGVFAAWYLFKLQHCEETETSGIRKKIKSVLIAGVGVMVISGTFTAILSYYK